MKNPIIYPASMNPDDAKASSEELTANISNPLLSALSLVTGYELGESDEYLVSIINVKDVDKLEYGESVCIFSPTGSGKTNVVEQTAFALEKQVNIIFLTNRRACKIQQIKDFLKKYGLKEIPEELTDKLRITENIEVMTYQDFVKKRHRYHGKKFLLVCDECHCFAEDSTFSVYPQQMINFIRSNLDNTKRIYLTATPNDVLPMIWDIEALSDKKLYPLTKDNFRDFLRNTPVADSTRIGHTYIMKSDWSYLTFKAYAPDKKDDLIEYINKFCSDG